ncbi:MAG: bifunctional 4-hydroxy-2-oxoglutarate aldolase/2-dehydro-3-deoxy-phosphogluconate aldolase [Candidatus Omnitrophota bacterium]
MDISLFKEAPVMGILRGIEIDIVEELIESVIASGLKTIEVAMNTPDAAGVIKKIAALAQGRIMLGAGTVLTMDNLNSALDSGATFIVLPVLIPEVVGHCAVNNIPVFPGALTPQEVYSAWLAGATMVKVFPAKFFGPEYFKELKGPFPDIELLACGGINVNTINDYFSCGADAAAFGASIFKKELIQARQFSLIKKEIQSLLGKLNQPHIR